MRAPDGVFDGMADDYDERFTATTIGTLMRKAVWARCAARFGAGSRVLEMNCGTGEDALWLVQRGVRVLATDISGGMLRIARAKLAASPDGTLAEFRRLPWEELDTLDEAPFDGALSNFGGLNCVLDLDAAARALSSKLRPGAAAILCIMGPTVPWEWAWFLARGRPAAAFRRLRRCGASWSGLTIHYPSIAATRRAFSPCFRIRRVAAVGALFPPPYAGIWIRRHPRLTAALERLERRYETRWPLPLLADHYVVEMERL